MAEGEGGRAPAFEGANRESEVGGLRRAFCWGQVWSKMGTVGGFWQCGRSLMGPVSHLFPAMLDAIILAFVPLAAGQIDVQWCKVAGTYV